MSLDTSNDLDHFPIAIIFDYHYHDLERAYWRLKQYAKLIRLSASGMATLSHRGSLRWQAVPKHVFIFDRLRGDTEDVQPLRREFQQIITLLSSQRRPVRIEEGESIKAIHWDNERIVIELEKPSATPVPILIKSSYFPNWHRVDSTEALYMATPTFIFTFAQENSADTEIQRRRVRLDRRPNLYRRCSCHWYGFGGWWREYNHSRRASKIRIHGEYRIRNHDSSQHLLRRR